MPYLIAIGLLSQLHRRTENMVARDSLSSGSVLDRLSSRLDEGTGLQFENENVGFDKKQRSAIPGRHVHKRMKYVPNPPSHEVAAAVARRAASGHALGRPGRLSPFHRGVFQTPNEQWAVIVISHWIIRQIAWNITSIACMQWCGFWRQSAKSTGLPGSVRTSTCGRALRRPLITYPLMGGWDHSTMFGSVTPTDTM